MQILEYNGYVFHFPSILWRSLNKNVGKVQNMKLQFSIKWTQFFLEIYIKSNYQSISNFTYQDIKINIKKQKITNKLSFYHVQGNN